ncbi:MAG: BspA family leucine-rich repeat surface protein [Bacteroidales bacterium]|nr:BspA family leucine-rich repeat surface protein [Bacteroidales bacterium]
MTLTSESTPPYLWHKPQKSAETQSFSPLLSNNNQGNNDFQYVSVLNTILNSPLEVEPEAYAVFSDGTLTFYYDKNKPAGAIELQPSYYFNTPWLGGGYETVVFDKSFKNYKPTSTACWFYGLFNLKEIKGLENLNTEKVTDMQFMFNACFLIESLDLSGFDVSNVTDMTAMFTNCYNLHTIFVGDNWNLSDNLPSTNMFADCYSLYGEQGSMPESYKVYDASMAQIDGGDNAPGYFTKKGNSKATVTSIDFSVNPYSEHTLGEPINRQSGILNVYFNNREAQYLQYNHVNITPSGYDSTRVGKQTVTVKLLNATTTYEVNVSAKDTSYAYLDDNGVLTLYYGEYKQGAIFGSKNLLNNPGTVKKVIIDKSFANYHPTTCAEWFQFFNNMTEIKGLENLNTQYVTDMSRMFYSLQSLTTIDVSKLNTENVTSMSEMFTDCQSLTTLDVSNFNTEKVTNMSSMFGYCYNLKTIYVGDKWTTKNVTESEDMFKYSNNLYGGKGTAYNADFIDATYAHIDGGAVAPGYFTLKINNPYTKPEIKDDFYQIGNVEELLWFVFDVNNGDTKANAQLTNDIVVNKDCMERITKLLGISKAADDLTVWQPIGTLNNAYAGIFDGQGHYISGIYINNKNEENVGLFGVTSTDAVIKNIGITDSYIAAKENVGAIVGNNNGIVANCYSTATIESQPNAQNVNGIAGKVSENAVVANSYYLTSEANTNDPQAKTLAEFKSGEVAQLLAEGATINGEKISGDSFAGIVDLPGTENLEELTTPTSELSINSNIRIWSFENTIFVENGCNRIEIVDMAGRVVKQVTPNSNRTEISLSNSGIYIVKTGVKTQKVIVR